MPQSVTLVFEGGEHHFSRAAAQLCYKDVLVELTPSRSGQPRQLAVAVTADKTPVIALRISWKYTITDNKVLFMGGNWRELNGGAQWRSMDPLRKFPWYFLARTSVETCAFAAMTQCAAFVEWSVNPGGVEALLDLRNGTRGVVLGGRRLDAAVLIERRYDLLPLAAYRALCAEISPHQILPPLPVYGAAYNISNNPDELIQASELLMQLSEGLTNRPFLVIGCGWEREQHHQLQPCGPWDRGNRNFPDMTQIVSEIRARGLRPGLSLRLLCNVSPELPLEWRQQRDPQLLDPSIPEVLEFIKKDISRISEWGFELIRYIYSTSDCLGPDWHPGVFTGPEWSFADTSKTTAEVIVGFYRAVRMAMGDLLLWGDDIIPHLAAGFMHIGRICRSAPDWQRRQHNRVNALAFRLGQNGTYFKLDTGAVTISKAQPWGRVREWARLAAVSGSTFMITPEVGSLTPTAKRELKKCFETASLSDAELIPTDWLNGTCPSQWKINGTMHRKEWYT